MTTTLCTTILQILIPKISMDGKFLGDLVWGLNPEKSNQDSNTTPTGSM